MLNRRPPSMAFPFSHREGSVGGSAKAAVLAKASTAAIEPKQSPSTGGFVSVIGRLGVGLSGAQQIHPNRCQQGMQLAVTALKPPRLGDFSEKVRLFSTACYAKLGAKSSIKAAVR